jgi:hypothetical protein
MLGWADERMVDGARTPTPCFVTPREQRERHGSLGLRLPDVNAVEKRSAQRFHPSRCRRARSGTPIRRTMSRIWGWSRKADRPEAARYRIFPSAAPKADWIIAMACPASPSAVRAEERTTRSLFEQTPAGVRLPAGAGVAEAKQGNGLRVAVARRLPRSPARLSPQDTSISQGTFPRQAEPVRAVADSGRNSSTQRSSSWRPARKAWASWS